MKHTSGQTRFKQCAWLVALAISGAATAAPVTVVPGSPAGYSYVPNITVNVTGM